MLAFSSFAQETDRDFIRLGNKFYNEGLMDEAATSYNKALDKKKSFEAHYNLANVYALSGQDSTAFEEYKKRSREHSDDAFYPNIFYPFLRKDRKTSVRKDHP